MRINRSDVVKVAGGVLAGVMLSVAIGAGPGSFQPTGPSVVGFTDGIYSEKDGDGGVGCLFRVWSDGRTEFNITDERIPYGYPTNGWKPLNH